jgi:opacity protein-like surface antigen
MRTFLAAAFAFACLTALSACSHSAPPTGRWEGTYVTHDVIIAARVEITAKGDIFLSAPDATGIGGASDDDRAAIRQRLAEGLNESWGSVTARQMDFDGKTFRKPGGIAPQMEWDSSTNAMTLIVYFGTAPEIHIALHPVKDFSSDPFSGS